MKLPKYTNLVREGVYQYRNPLYIAKHGKSLTLTVSEENSVKNIFSKIETLNNIFQKKEKSIFKKTKTELSNVVNISSANVDFESVAISEFEHWKKEETNKGIPPKIATIKEREQYFRILTSWFGKRKIDKITIADCAEFLANLNCRTGKYRRARGILLSIFAHAIATGVYKQANPVRDTLQRKKAIPQRLPMQLDQYNAIYAIAPDWVQVAMDIAMETSLRCGDIRQIKWTDIHTENGVRWLVVIPEKTGIRKKGDDRIYLAERKVEFNLNENPKLDAAIRRAEKMRDDANKKLSVIRNCPHVVANYSPEKINTTSKTKKHVASITASMMAHKMQKLRDKVNTEKQVFVFDGIEYAYEQLPAWHGIRKLSLFLLSQQHGKEAARARADHHDIETTIKSYLQTVAPQRNDVTFARAK